VLVPVDDPGPLWQYVRFQWLARGGAASDSDFTHQPFPLSTTKWWPEEGPAAPTGPLAQKAAEPSAPGVPPAFFNHASAYLGQDPLPTCSGVEALAAGPPHRPEPGLLAPPQYTADIAQTAPGKDVGGDAASLAPNAPFVDWRGSVGAYQLGSVNSNMPGWLKALPDPLPVPDVVDGKLKITDISLSGLHGMIVAPVVATSVAGLHIMATAGPLSCAAMISVEGIIENDPATVTISSIGVDGVARVVTPLAVPADDSTHWYVPYVGPQPFSYATPPFATTQMISDASLATVTVTAGTITVDVGNATLDAIIDGLILLVKQQLENTLASALQGAVNGLLGNLYDGTKRF
jgi:hypothetical protein